MKGHRGGRGGGGGGGGQRQFLSRVVEMKDSAPTPGVHKDQRYPYSSACII